MSLTPQEIANEPVLSCPQGLTMVEYPGTNMFKKRAILYDGNGDKVITLLWLPHSSIIDARNMLVEVANPLLYNNKYLHLPDLLQSIHTNTWVSLSRLDLATDFQPTIVQSQVIDMLQQGSVYVQGKQDGTMWHHYNLAAKYVTREPHQLAWGHKSSQIKWKLYNKTKEIFETTPTGRTWCNKPYIADMWRRNGFNPQLETWRVECSIMGSGQLQWHEKRLDWETINHPDTFTALFYDLYSTRMKMRLNEGHENKRYDHEVEFLQVPEQTTSRIQRAIPSEEKSRVTFAATIRALVKELDRPEVRISAPIHQPLLSSLDTIVRAAQLDGYFSKVTGKHLEEWIDAYKNGEDISSPPEKH